MTYLRRRLVPQRIRDKIKNSLTMDTRPEINEENLQRLVTLFDKDLAILGADLGVELSCTNFKQVVSNQQFWFRE